MNVKVIQIKKSPPMWSVKVGHRYRMGFMGADARAKAEAYAAEQFGDYTVVEKPTPAREQRRLAASPNAGLSGGV